MKIICKDIGCFMLTLVYLENLMGDMQYKMWFSFRVGVGPTSHPQCFSGHLPFSFLSGVELKFCLLSENVKSCLNGNYLQCYRMFYVGTILLRKLDSWYSIQNVIFYQSKIRYPHPQCFSVHLPFLFFSGFELKLCLLSENVNILLQW